MPGLQIYGELPSGAGQTMEEEETDIEKPDDTTEDEGVLEEGLYETQDEEITNEISDDVYEEYEQ